MLINEAEQIKELPARLLETEEIWRAIGNFIESFREPPVYNSDLALTRKFLEEKLSEPEITDETKQKYAKLLLISRFYSLLNAGKDGRSNLLKEKVLAALANNIKVKELLEDYLIYSNDISSDDRELSGLLKAFKENQENLAGRPLREWLRGYLSSIKSVEAKRGAVERLNFINSDPEVKTLEEADKNVLLKAIELLDWLEFPDEEKLKVEWDVVVAKKDGSEEMMKMSEFNELKKRRPMSAVPAPGLRGSIQPKTFVPALTPQEVAPVQIRPTSPPTRTALASAKLVPQQVVTTSVKPTPKPVVPPQPTPQPIFAPTIERYDAAAEELVKESGLTVAPELQQRFKMIVVSRLKEVRKWVETRQKLMSPMESGGMGFSFEQAEKFLKLVDEKKEGLLKIEIASVASLPRKVVETARNDKKVVATPPPLPPAPPSVPQTPPSHPVMPLVPRRDSTASPQNDRKTSSDIVKATPQPLKIVQQEKAAPKIELAPLLPAQIKPAPKIAIPQTPTGRSKMEDVAYKPRLVGPVEELREMTLVDFRRLSPQAKVTADKIYAKIELLAEESYEKKINGIKAWQESEVNKMYLGLLNESVDRALPVQKMIEERHGAGRQSLTYEEFKTVMELNRRLRS